MSRDRLAERRAQQGQGQSAGRPGYQDSYELSYTARARANNPFAQQDDFSDEKVYNSTTNLNAAEPSDFLSEITRVQQEIRQYEGLVDQIATLHATSISAVDDKAAKNAHQLEELMEDATAASAMIKRRITALKNWKGPERNPQLVALTSNKFVEAIQKYQGVEKEFRTKYRQRMERQARIVQPGATDEQIQAIVEADQPVFTQELKNSNRIGEATSAYREVKARHDDIQKIEKTLVELSQLFNDMSILIQQQDEQIEAIHTNVVTAEGDLESGLKETTVAVKHARSARSLRKWCFGITVVIIIIIVIVVLVTVVPKLNNKSSN